MNRPTGILMQSSAPFRTGLAIMFARLIIADRIGLGIGWRYGLQPIFDVPGLIVPIGTDFYSGSADGTIQSAASAFVQSIAAFTPTVAAKAISERSEEYSRHDFWLAQARPANHMAPI